MVLDNVNDAVAFVHDDVQNVDRIVPFDDAQVVCVVEHIVYAVDRVVDVVSGAFAHFSPIYHIPSFS